MILVKVLEGVETFVGVRCRDGVRELVSERDGINAELVFEKG